jgi:glycosyltransferase involved in cell wall biosynthesis
MHDSVDILLPTYRRSHTLGFAIESVLNQTHRDFLLHIIGDGCPDETESVVRGFDDPRIRFQRFPKSPGFAYGIRRQPEGRALHDNQTSFQRKAILGLIHYSPPCIRSLPWNRFGQ